VTYKRQLDIMVITEHIYAQDPDGLQRPGPFSMSKQWRNHGRC
jgi:hypothetical protein